ncbi:transposase [Streptococcus pneumoniae]|nr:transposase [Streptococcus pneumoniae]
MEQLHFITKLLDIKDTNIQIIDVVNRDSHKEIIAKLDYDAPSCPECGNQLKKYDFQKPSKIPYLETTGMPTRILLRKRRFKCYHCSKMMVHQKVVISIEMRTFFLYSSAFKKHSSPSPINDGLYHLLLQSLYDILKLIHDIFQNLKGFILKSTFTNLFPHLFNGVHLWCVWRNKCKANISRNL